MFIFKKLQRYIINKHSTKSIAWMVIRHNIDITNGKSVHINSIPRGVFLHKKHDNLTLVSTYYHRKKHIEILKDQYNVDNIFKHKLFLFYLTERNDSDPHYIIHTYNGEINFVVEDRFGSRTIYDFEKNIKIYTLTKFVNKDTFAYNITEYKRGVQYRSYNESIINGYPMFRSMLENNLFMFVRKPINSNNTLYYNYYGKPLHTACVIYFDKEIESFIIGHEDIYRVYSLAGANLSNVNLLKNIYCNAFDQLNIHYTNKIYNPDTELKKLKYYLY